MKSIFEIESKFVNETLKGGGTIKDEINLLKTKYELNKSKISKLTLDLQQNVTDDEKNNINNKLNSLNIKAVEIQTQISI